MAGYLSKVGEILDLAESKRMTDRRKFLDELDNVYANDDYVEAINVQTAKNCNSNRSWNAILLTIHRIALLEAGKPLGKNSITQSACSSLMLKTVRLATDNADISLCCDDLIAMSFQIWGSKIYQLYHDTYMKIMVQYVLTNETLRLEITADQWREILRVSMAMYTEGSDEFKSNLLEGIELVVRYGCLQSHLLLEVKKMLPFLDTVFRDIGTRKAFMLKQLFEMTHTVCLQIGTESRIALCEFSENSLSPIICLEASPEMYKMLLLFIKMHHPGGARSIENDGNNDGAYARDWNRWKNIIRGIYGTIVRDMKTKKLEPCFLELYCEVYRQILGHPMHTKASSNRTVTQQDEVPRKFRRLAPIVEKPIDMLHTNNTWPNIQILTVLLRKHPNTLKSSDYLEFLKNVQKLLEGSLDNEAMLSSLCELFTVLVEYENQHYRQANDDETLEICWQHIWQTVLRASTMNANEVPCHELLQSIMRNRDVPNPQAFLRLYLKRSIGWSASSVETLLTFCSCSSIPASREAFNSPYAEAANPESSIRASLLQWALDLPVSTLSTDVPVASLGKLLTCLAVKLGRFENYDDPVGERDPVKAESSIESELLDDRESKSSRDIERCNLTLIFRTNIFDDAEELKKIDDRQSKTFNCDHGCEILEDIFESLVATLTDSLANPVTEKSEIIIRIMKTALTARVMSNFAEYDVAFDGERISKLVRAFTEAYTNILSIFMTMKKSSLTPSSYLVADAIEGVEKLYCTRYHRRVEKIIDELSSLDFMKFIDDLVPAENSKICRGDNSGDRKSTSTKTSNTCNVVCRIRNSADKIVTYFCCVRVGGEICAGRITLLRNFTKTVGIRRCSRNTCIRRAIRLLTACRFSDEPSRSNDYLDVIIELVKELLKTRWKDEKTVRLVLMVVPSLTNAATAIASTRGTDSLANILSKINKCLANENYGPLVHAEFVKCLARIIALNPGFNWQISTISQSSEPIIRHLINYIGNRFYVVRLEAVRALHVAFSSNKLDLRWKLKFFDEVIIAMRKLLVPGELAVSADEIATRTITAVHIIAAVISADDSRELHSRAVLAIIDLSVERDVKLTTIKQGLLLSATSNRGNVAEWPCRLVEMNLHKLLSRWLEADYPFDQFPWILTNCDCLEDFLRRYIDILVIIKLQRLEFKHIEILCKNLEVSFSQTVENCFAPILSVITSMRIPDPSSLDNNGTSVVYATLLHEKLRSNVGEFSNVKNFVDLLDEKLPQVVVYIIERLHDQRHFDTMFETNGPFPSSAPQQLTFDRNTVEQCLRLLEKDLSLKNETLMKHLVVRRPWILQKISIALAININRVRTTDYEIQEFYRYAYFQSCVMEHLSRSYFNSMSLYIVKDVAHTLLGFIKDETLLSEMACLFFKKFLETALPTRTEEIKEIFSFTVSSLIPIIQNGKVARAITLLRYLIVERREPLAEAIEQLDSFPNEQAFEEIKRVHSDLKYRDNVAYSLEMEINHFLNAINDKTLSCSLEGLSHLNDQLATRKNELDQMYEKLEKMRGFAEDCASSTLHRFIYKLVQLTRASDRDISLEAAKCLGQLGPADLTTIILHPEKAYINEVQGENGFTLTVINRLSEYLVDNDIDLKIASAGALYGIFGTEWGWKFADKSYLEEIYMRVYGTKNSTLHDSIYPFVTSSNTPSKYRIPPIRIDANNLEILLKQSDDLWIPKNYDTYSKWITELTLKILDCFVNFYTRPLKPVCARSIELSEMLLPRLVTLLINTENSLNDEFSSCVNRFFGYVCESTRQVDDSIGNSSPYSPIRDIANRKDVALSHHCIRSMLSIVKFMRINSINNNKNLTFDYLSIANAADYSSAYFTSLLYAELSCQTLVQNSSFLHDNFPGSWVSAIDSICEINPRLGKLLQHIVREAYLHIDDPDSIYGCGLSHSIDPSFRAQHYTHIRQWDKVMLEQDMELNCSATAPRRDMLNALRKSGYEYLLGVVIDEASSGQADTVEDFVYEAAWRLADWNVLGSHPVSGSVKDNFTISNNSDNWDFHASHYRALAHLHDGTVAGLKNAVISARTSIVQSLRKKTLECSQTVYPILSQLQILREIEEFAGKAGKPDSYNKLLREWNEKDLSDTHDFRYVEPILSQRLTMCQIQKSDSNFSVIMDNALINTHLKMAEVAEKQGYLSMASRALDTLGEKIDLSDAARHSVTYQKALLAWKDDERHISRYLLKDLIKSPTLNPSLRAEALRICGNWMAETKCEKPQAIIKNYYDESINTNSKVEGPSSTDVKTLSDARSDLGQFAHAQYQQIIRFTKSTRYKNLVRCSKNDNADQLGKTRTDSLESTDETDATIARRQQANDDASELEDIKREKDTYLVLAIKNYLKTLQSSNDHDLVIFRLVSLWFDNTFHDELNEILEENLPRVPSYKFVALLYQIAPHMNNVLNDFTVKIRDLMERCAKQHPHHTLPVLLALKNTYKDEDFETSSGGSRKSSKTRPEPRVDAATKLVSQLMNTNIRPIIQEISQLSHALVMLAYHRMKPADENKTGVPHSIPIDHAIMRIRGFQHTIVPTITLNVSPSGNYDNIVSIREYVAKFDLPGGVNKPKKLICVGTDGIRRSQMVKGHDDLRQDAVMEQVFTVMNTMLKTSRETKRRRLHIRTYKIVPLSRRSGILEWCDNTLPISHVLTDSGGKPGMHTKYYPKDWSTNLCKKKLSQVQSKSRDVKLATFLECCRNLHPAFHHFFIEKYPSAETWFERRLAYVRSVATTSMVGYMLGLGDRHFSNILIDQTTAEVIHIDFGIAFAQGKVLPIPETVPFRLTRDMEVAMGICGVEGVMRRSCEVTVAVLRDKREILRTVLQVLLYDPLFSWAITPLKTIDCTGPGNRFGRRLTDYQDEKNTNEIAEKALLRIDEKLQGTADGLSLSISGQVERLIRQARDPANLCRLYCGWQPYL